MRASLASATSLLALLLVEGHEAKAGPVVTTTQSSLNFGDVLVGQTSNTSSSTWGVSGQGSADVISISAAAAPFVGVGMSSATGGTTPASLAFTYSFAPVARGVASNTITGYDSSATGTRASLTLTGTGVAPVESISASNYVLVTPGGGAINLTVSNIGNGNLSGAGTLSNLRGTVGSGNSVFVGSGGSINLGDPTQAVTATSATYGYTYTPTISGQSASTTVVTKFSDGSANGANSQVSITTTLSGTGVAPVASIAGSASAGYVLVTSSATTTFSVGNVGNGNLAGSGTAYNLNGSIGSLSSNGFTGAASSIGLASNATGSTSSTATTSSPTYTYKPTIVGSSSALVVETLSNGSTNGQNLASNQTTTLTGTGVAPIGSISNSTAYGRLGSGTVGNGTIVVHNVGNGNLAGSGTAYNLNGSIAALSSGAFKVSAGSVGLASNATGSTASTATSTLNYTYMPGSTRGTSSLSASIAFSNGSSAGTDAAQAQSTVLTGSAVGPTYASTLSGSSTAFGVTKGSGTVAGAAAGTISFGTVSYKTTKTLLLDIGNTTTDANGGNPFLTDLSILAFSITGANASAFSVGTAASVITEGGELVVPITVTSNAAYSSLTSSLTIFTDESTGFGGYGDNFTYALSALSVPEPTSLAVLGAGLLGLAGLRRRKRGAQKG